ncbi:hypothetical protein CEXT_84261 [Caerostris extrusa]|uniref:Uncharacterized protein n=1 Tax=Caerostris extrusa TaxID=172846 RepID=A0AAV4MWJ8_CAEEX|nr:hypothetical protein CEXT_84261 [Caerostris extrusa]
MEEVVGKPFTNLICDVRDSSMSGHGITKILKLNDYSVIGCERIGHLEVSAAILKRCYQRRPKPFGYVQTPQPLSNSQS